MTHISLQEKFLDISVAIVKFFPVFFHKHDPKLLRSAASTWDRLSSRCVTVADKSIPLSILTKQGLFLGLRLSHHTKSGQADRRQ